jgi:hypothetical protein
MINLTRNWLAHQFAFVACNTGGTIDSRACSIETITACGLRALVGSPNDAAERPLRVSAPPGAIAAPQFPRDHQAVRRRMGRVIPRRCYARIVADVQDASPFRCANWILRQFPGGQRPRAGQHDLHPAHARWDCRIPLFGGCVVRAVCSLWRVAVPGGWRGKANGRRSGLGFRHRGCRCRRAGRDPRDVRQSRVARKGAWSIRNPSDNSVAAWIPHDALASCRLGIDQTGSHQLDSRDRLVLVAFLSSPLAVVSC